MPVNKYLDIKEISLDLNNYRTISQKSEEDSIRTMIAIKPERFFAVVESIIENGYLPTENLLILNCKDGYVVKEGNRRTAALKLIHEIHPGENFKLPDVLKKKIDNIDKNWIKENSAIPCNIFSLAEKEKVDKIVNLTHAKGEKASRDPWTSVAKARQNRDEKKASEPALDLLEKYLKYGENLTNQQKKRWSGDYPLTVLDEALRNIDNRLGFSSLSKLADTYPKIKLRYELENILRDIGLKVFGFKEIRSKTNDFAFSYNIPKPQNQSSEQQSGDSASTTQSQNSSSNSLNTSNLNQQNQSTSSSNNSSSLEQHFISSSNKLKSYAICDQRTVTQTLKKFNPEGSGRQKLVTLRDELKLLKVKDNPLAFCFLLRSMFEISALIYSQENSICTTIENKGKTKQITLQQRLSAVTKHLTDNDSNKEIIKILHGANSELAKSVGLLSVTSMNQLVHNTSFYITPQDIFTLFNSVYPLLEAMN